MGLLFNSCLLTRTYQAGSQGYQTINSSPPSAALSPTDQMMYAAFPTHAPSMKHAPPKSVNLSFFAPNVRVARVFRFIPLSARHPLLRITRTGRQSTRSNRVSTAIQARHHNTTRLRTGPVACTKSAAWALLSVRSNQRRNRWPKRRNKSEEETFLLA